MRRFRDFAAAIALGTALAVVAPHEARAQWSVFCTNCSTFPEQLASYAKQALQYETELQQYATQLRQYANMLQNTVQLPEMIWNNAQADIMQVRNLMNAGQMLGGNAASFTQRLGNLSSYANQLSSLTDMAQQYQIWANVTRQDITQLQGALGLQQTEQADDARLLGALQQHSQNAMGQMQAIQAGNEIASAGVSQMQKLQVMLSTQIQLQADQAGVQADRQASQDEALSKFLGAPMLPTTGGATY